MLRGRVVLAACAVLLGACYPDPYLPSLCESEHFALFTDPDVEPPDCPTVLARLERHHKSFHELTGLEAKERIRYTRTTGGHCVVRRACASGRDVYSTAWFHEHELIHAYLYDAIEDYPPDLFNEGAATALTCDSDISSDLGDAALASLRQLSVPQLLALESGFDGDEPVYQAGAAIVSTLLQRYGARAVIDMIVASAGASDVAALIEQRFGVTLEDVARDSLARPSQTMACIPFITCETAELAALPLVDLPLSVGAARAVTFDAPMPLHARTDTGVSTLDSCTDPSMISWPFNMFAAETVVPPGRYVVRNRTDEDLRVSVAAGAPLRFATDCAAAQALSAPVLGTEYRVEADAARDLYFAVPMAAGISRFSTATGLPPTVDAPPPQVCSSCALSDCTPLVDFQRRDGACVVVVPASPSEHRFWWLSVIP